MLKRNFLATMLGNLTVSRKAKTDKHQPLKYSACVNYVGSRPRKNEVTYRIQEADGRATGKTNSRI